jgi:hypothetical protein
MMNQSNFHLMVVNHTPHTLEFMHTRVRVVNMDGSVAMDNTFPGPMSEIGNMSFKPCSVRDLGPIGFPNGLSPVHFVKTELLDAQGKVVSDNFYWRGNGANNLTALAGLPPADIEVNIVRHDAGGKCLLDVTLTNSSNVVALMTHIQLRKQGSNERVLPVFYDDNYISLLPGESRTIKVEAASKDLAGDNPLVVVDGWNPVVKSRSFSGGASIAPNIPALVIGALAAKP